MNTNEVFGVRNTLIQSYIDRSLVDEKFKEALQEGNEIVGRVLIWLCTK